MAPILHATQFPFDMIPMNNISAPTYRDGVTYTRGLEQLKVWLNTVLVPEFNAGIDNAFEQFAAGLENMENRVIESEAAYDLLINGALASVVDSIAASKDYTDTEVAAAKAYVDAIVNVVNNKTGNVQIQRINLTAAPTTLTVDPLWPSNHPANISVKQDATGGRPLTLGAGIVGNLELDKAPNGITDFVLLPKGGGVWEIHQPSLITTSRRGITPQKFGAVADGVGVSNFASVFTGTDNTAAIQAAINAAIALKQPLYIPAGKYVVTDTLTVNGSLEIRAEVGTTLLGKIYDKTKPVMAIIGNRRGLIENLGIIGAGWLPLAGFQFKTTDSQAMVLRNVSVSQCRHGVYVNQPEVVNRIVIDKSEFVSNLLCGIYMNNFNGGTYGQSGPMTFTHVICNANGIPNDPTASWFTPATTYEGVTVLSAGDNYGRQVFVRGFVNLTWLGGQISDHSANKLINLAEFAQGSGLNLSGVDFEDIQTPVTAAGAYITDVTAAPNYPYNEGTACAISAVAGVNISQVHTFEIDTQSLFKVSYGCLDVVLSAVNYNGTGQWAIDAFGNVGEGVGLTTRIQFDGAPSRVSPRAMASMDRSKLVKLTSIKSGLAPQSAMNAHFDYMGPNPQATKYVIGYYGGDWNNPDLTQSVYWERNVSNLAGIFTVLLCKANTFTPDGHYFLIAYDGAGAILSVNHRDTNGADAVAGGYSRNEYWSLPAGTKKVRYGFINNGNFAGSIPDNASVNGLQVFGVTNNFNSVPGNTDNVEEKTTLGVVERNVRWGTVAPTTGLNRKGSIVFHSNPAVAGNVGWVCTVTGTPGTWNTFGTIS